MVDRELRVGTRGGHGSRPVVKSVDAAETAAKARMVIVPRRPGLPRAYHPHGRRPRDEFDDLIDELFGPVTQEKPSRFDAALVVVGLGLVGWAIVLSGPNVALWVGIAAIVLGLVLPTRALLRRFDWAPTGGLRRRIVDRGTAMDASHPATVALIDVYAHLMQMSCLQGVGDPKRAVSAGHLAVTEVATRHRGQPPDTPAQRRYVSVRTEALEAISRAMLRSHDRWTAREALDGRAPDREDAPDFSTGSEWEPLDALARSDAMAQLKKLNEQLQKEVAGGSS